MLLESLKTLNSMIEHLDKEIDAKKLKRLDYRIKRRQALKLLDEIQE